MSYTDSKAVIVSDAVIVRRTDGERFSTAETARLGFLACYRGSTRKDHASELRFWHEYCRDLLRIDVMSAQRAHIQSYARWLEEIRGLKPSTIAHKLGVVCGFYTYASDEDLIGKNPGKKVLRPKWDHTSTRDFLDRHELSAFLMHADTGDRRDVAICMLLGLNGLRISEALGADIEDLSHQRGHRTLRIMGKGSKPATIPLHPKTANAIQLYIDDREAGPIFLGTMGGRMDRWAAARIIKRVCKVAGVSEKNITPHSLRHTAITNLLDAGVPLRDVQHFARHVDPRTTSIYDHGRQNLDAHPTYILAPYALGAR